MTIAYDIADAFEFLDYSDALAAAATLEAETGYEGRAIMTNYLVYVVEVRDEEGDLIGYVE
jgi:hypothetical protein